MKPIMIFHPEGNLNVNPNLTGIVDILCEHGVRIHYYCHRKDGVPQSAWREDITYIFLENGVLRLVDSYALVIGVDRDGILVASKVAQHLRVPYGLITYEIFFADETGVAYKQPEIEACSKIQFAICQGDARSRELARENQIPLGKIIDIPVAGRGIRRGNRNPVLHTALKLPPEMKIVLYIGSVISKWAMTEALIANTRDWDENWVLVLHNRYDDDQYRQFRQYYSGMERVCFSPQSGLSFDEMQTLIHAADLGVALYQPTFANQYEGKNLEFLGLSSGKISSYLQHGIPVVVNDIGEMSKHVDDFQLGVHVRSLDELPARLSATHRDAIGIWRENCFGFFEKYLDLNVRIAPLLDWIGRLRRDGGAP